MFDRTRKTYTDTRKPDLDFYNRDEYLALWLTNICYPDMLPRMTFLKDKPEIRSSLSMIGWGKLNYNKENPEEVF